MVKICRNQGFKAFVFIIVLILGISFRFYGQNWDKNFHLHPDERFLTMVETSISSTSISDYFDTNISTLNPHNLGFSFFVYGTFPLFLVRYIAEWTNNTGYDQVHLVGRTLAAIFDIGTILLTFLISIRILKSTWGAIIASSLYAFSVLPIQQSHFFTVDLFGVFFTSAALYFATLISPIPIDSHSEGCRSIYSKQQLIVYIAFGMSIGLAAASKINNVVFALLMPLAFTIQTPGWFKKRNTANKVFLAFLLSAFIFFITFRIAQPYAFSGPGFFGLIPNIKWIENLRELSILSSGNSNYPPSLQWARRDWTFAGKNLVMWGIGLPFGISALIAYITLGLKIIKGDGKKYTLLWIWTGAFFLAQSFTWNPTMRYLLPIYPWLAIITAWFLSGYLAKIWNNHHDRRVWQTFLSKLVSVLIISICILGTFIWAISFVRIYKEPMTRIAASEWIYRNMEGAFNLHISTSDDTSYSQPLPYPHYSILESGSTIKLKTKFDKTLKAVGLIFDHIVNADFSTNLTTISVQIVNADNAIVGKGKLTEIFSIENDPRGKSYRIEFENGPVEISSGLYDLILINANTETSLKLSGGLGIYEFSENAESYLPIIDWSPSFRTGDTYAIDFSPFETGTLEEFTIFRAIDIDSIEQEKIVIVEVLQNGEVLTRGKIQSSFLSMEDHRGDLYRIQFERKVQLDKDETYRVLIKNISENGNLLFNGSLAAKETDWDDALPLFMYGYNPFDYHAGVFQSDLNFDMYAADNSLKLARFERILSRADYVVISSNRQWGSTTQIPERYPLTSAFYKYLLNCPDNQDLQNCYRDAKTSNEIGELGYRLAKVFQSDPGIGRFNFNSQYAEEAFTVYDHPKVMIFKKEKAFNEDAKSILKSIDIEKVLNITPAEANNRPGDLSLSKLEFANVNKRGTWSELFSRSALINKNPLFGVVVWYLLIFVLGILYYPVTRLIFCNLHDKGYSLSRILGLLFFGISAWLFGSMEIEVTRQLLGKILIGSFCILMIVAWYSRSEILREIQTNLSEILRFEAIFFILFMLFLVIRLGNPDLWHPYKGGEKPMDFAYLNAVIKSGTFPPYDPWYAGGYINYYYLGFVLSAMPIKLIGIIPSVSYNLILPTFFAFTGSATYCIGYNFWFRFKSKTASVSAWKIGLIFILFVLFFGNLGTIKLFFNGFVNLGSGGLSSDPGILGSFQTLGWFVRGVIENLKGVSLPFYPGDFYWIPSRALPGEPITEFPFFTFLYADPHAHLFSLPITLLALCWTLNLVFIDQKILSFKRFVFNLLIGASIVGSLRAINSWDWPLQLVFSSVAIIFSFYKNPHTYNEIYVWIPEKIRFVFHAIFSLGIFTGMNHFIVIPFISKYGQAYTRIDLWNGLRTPIRAYLIHWGIFLFFITSWLLWHFIKWIKLTHLSELSKWRPYKGFFTIFSFLIIFAFLFLLRKGVFISYVVFPILVLCIWLIVFSKAQDVEKLIALLIFMGLSLTIFVEIFVLRGDIGRMNTVFKFYLQAWMLLALASAFGFSSLVVRIRRDKILRGYQLAWIALAIILIFSALLYPITASMDKIHDRMNEKNQLTLDGMDFMANAIYQMGDKTITLSYDYKAIRWIQENIQGTPVIMEAHDTEYRWGNRISIYTGLPSVVGWNWHQRQQRAINPWEWVFERIDDVNEFYSTDDLITVKTILSKYGVDYIIVGELERALYPDIGLNKFAEYAGKLWQSVYRDGTTIIYKVII